MYKEMCEKVAVVTGGGSGLGRSICLKLAESGAFIVPVGRKMEPLEETVEMIASNGGNAFAVTADITDSAQVKTLAEKVMEHYGHIDYLVNNAGMAIESRLGLRICETDEELWDQSIELNLNSVYRCCKYIIPCMLEGGFGRIVNISSVAGYFPAFGASYAAAKAGVIALTKSIAMQYCDDNIRCNTVCPGPMKTPHGMAAKKEGTMYSGPQPRVRMIDRVAEPEEMANAVAFLLSEEASFINATEIKVDGGSMALSVSIPPRK